jgi:peroxiredoxin
MFSIRRTAQFGLGAALIVLVASLSLLFARSHELPNANPIRVGVKAPDFTLQSIDKTPWSLAEMRAAGKVTVLYFNSLNCRVCNEYDDRVAALVQKFASEPRVQFAVVNADPGRNLQEIRVQTRLLNRSYPTLIDEDLELSRALDVRMTPYFIVIDARGVIQYRGALDNHRDATKATWPYLEQAIWSVLQNKPVDTELTQGEGCPIAYR